VPSACSKGIPIASIASRSVGTHSELRRDTGPAAKPSSCSRKHLATRFREHVGLPPKLLARLLRFRYAVDVMRSSPQATIAEVAATCGYYHQAHLDRDVRDFAARTPTEYIADPHEPVTFVQDTATAAS
jgi:AraC-like DNA-binding protein